MSVPLPEASIVLATYNRAPRLAACLASLADQSEPPARFEVVVVVDGSTDETMSLLASFSPAFPLRVIEQSNQGQCVALNRGAAEAHGGRLIFLDDDISVSPDFVRAHLSVSRRDPEAVGVGKMLLQPAPDGDWFLQAFAGTWRRHYERLDATPESVTWRDCFGGNMSVSRGRYMAVGGFTADLARGYDMELALRLAAAGCHFVYLPQARGVQDERKSFADLLRDAELGGSGAVAIYRRRPEALSLIGHFPEQTPQAAVVLRTLLRLRIAPTVLARLLWWAPRFRRAQLAFDLLHRYAFWRGVKEALGSADEWEQLSYGVVILMYHGFCEQGEGETRYVMSGARFTAQMQWLKRRGYRVIDIEAYVALRRFQVLPPGRTAIITIDDGYTEVASIAAPVCRSMGFPATVFVPTARLGQVNDWDPDSELSGRRLLSWSDVRTLSASGFAFGAHSRTHRELTGLGPEERDEEIFGPQLDFERETGRPSRSFSYPYGNFRNEFAELLERAGYAAGAGVDPGANTPLTGPYGLRRVEIRGGDSLLAFAYALSVGRELRAARRRARQTLQRAGGNLLGAAQGAWKSARLRRAAVTEKN